MKNIIWSTGHQIKFYDIVDSDNCFIFDSKGNKLIDLESGVWCTSVGHNNKRVNNVITSQINKITHTGFCYCHPQIDETAKQVLDITGLKVGKCEFLSSGSEAVEYGVKIARSISEKPLALTFSDSYLSALGDAGIKDKNSWYLYDWLDCSCSNKNNGCTGECKNFNNIPFDKIGVFIFEPGSSSGLVRFPSEQLISKIISKIKQNNGIIMCNEITTGIGRTGKWFGYQHYNFTPDIISIGKGIGNGYPVSITAISEEIALLLNSKNFKHSQSHQNDPLGAFVTGEVIKIIQDEYLLDQCELKGKYLLDELTKLKEEYSIIKQIRGRGLMIIIEFEKNSMLVYEELLKKGIIVAKRLNAEALRIDPALTIEKETIDIFLKAFKEICKKLNG